MLASGPSPSLISALRTAMYGIDASSTRNRFEFIQLLHSRAAAVINNQIEMPSITWNVCLMKRAGGLKKRKLQCFQRGDRHQVFFCQSGEVSIRVG